jgi:hypothetical protein
MAGDKEARAAALASAGAIALAAVALARKAQAAPSGEIVLPKEFVDLIVAIGNTTVDIDSLTAQIRDKLSSLGITVQGWPPNVKYTRTFVVVCAVVGRAYPAPDMAIPSGMSLLIKAHPLNPVGSIIYVATSAADAINPNSSYPLVPNEPFSLQVENSNTIYVSSNTPNAIAIFAAEQGGY